MIWKIRVRCTQQPDKRGLSPMCYEDCMVEAENAVDAMKDGARFVEDQAPTDVQWQEFLPLSAAVVHLPMLTK